MFGRRYKQGDDFLKNVVNYIRSPQAAQMFGAMSQGVPFGAAHANSQMFAHNLDEQERQRKIEEQLLGMKMADRGLNNEYKRAQIDNLNAPAPSPVTWNPRFDESGNIIGQINSLGKLELFKTAAPSAPRTRDLPLPSGQTQKQEYIDGVWKDYGAPYYSRDPYKQTTTIGADGSVNIGFVDTRTLGGEKDPTIVDLGQKSPPTADQTKAFGFANRLFNSASSLAEIDPYGEVASGAVNNTLNSIPGIGNYLVDSDFQQAEQSRLDATGAILRRESGAVIGQEEIKVANLQYFPQPGDKEEVIKQKRANLISQYTALYESSGPMKNKLKSPDELLKIFDQIKDRNEKQNKPENDPLGLFQ